jgi:formyltetrahydrofolate-dependent phosphoribosylglycinamide formyltransferase
MLKKLKEHWKVNGLNLILILATFAIGGSLCGWAGRKLLLLINLEKGVAWVFSYIVLITLLWPISVLLVSVPLGQFSFFKKYITRVWNKIRGKKVTGTTGIAIFASGAGSNAKKIIEYFDHPERKSKEIIRLIICNKAGAGVLNVARENNIPVLLIEKERFFNGDAYLPELKKYAVDLIILAGFLWKLPDIIIHAYPKKIINIHPALLPKYGGKGMYGRHVHEAVIANKDKESGISIHYADEQYDHGEIIFQATCEVNNSDTPETLAGKIHILEHKHYPVVIETILNKRNLR